MSDSHSYPVAIIGAGPVGLELAAALKRADIDYIHFDKGAIGQTMFWWPPQTQWFSSNERIGIAGVPVTTPDQAKATREQYLAYLRTVAVTHNLQIKTHQPVESITREGDGYTLVTRRGDITETYRAEKIVLAIGDTERPKRIDIPGEDLPHVTHVLEDPHKYFQRKLLIVGGKNSAAEAALRCYHAGASVTIACRAHSFDKKHIKHWLLPELMGRIQRREIACHYRLEPTAITPNDVAFKQLNTNDALTLEADFVLLATGFVADMTLFKQLGVELTGDNEVPAFNPDTMETNLPGVYVAGTATAGTQNHYTVFLENCHVHTTRIFNHLLGKQPPSTPAPNAAPET